MKKVLVIEDDAEIRDSLAQLLEIENFQVFQAENGQIGVELANTHLPDLIICDISMPVMDGYAVLTTLRNQPETAFTPFIFLTARVDKDSHRQGMNLGADDFVTKPFTLQEMLTAVNTRLNRHTNTQELLTGKSNESEELAHYLEQHDPLTNLPNRAFLEEHFKKYTSKSPFNITLLLVNLQRVNLVYYDLGYNLGDKLVVLAMERLRNCLPANTTLVLLSSSQLAILLMPPAEQQIVQLIQDSLALPFEVDGYMLYLDPIMGSATCSNEDPLKIEGLLKRANLAGRLAHEEGGNYHHFSEIDLQTITPLPGGVLLESALRQAVEHQEFELYYQPQINLATGQVTGAEALVRWVHPKWGLVSPANFIPLAEELRLIIPLGEWILKTACSQGKKWHDAGFDLKIAVNFSTGQLSQPCLERNIADILSESGLSPASLEIELTESAILPNFEAANLVLSKLKKIGIGIALDDFGTGFSSLTYLQKLPFNNLKIDRSFVSNIQHNNGNAAIVGSIIQLAHNLGLGVVAEGIEQQEEMAILKELGCDQSQGYLVSRPLSAEQFEQFLQASHIAVS